MRTPEQAKWDFIQQWLEKANADLNAVGSLLAGQYENYEVAGFHAQQAAEKYIKAYLVRHQTEFPKTHNIAHLTELVAKLDETLAKHLGPAEALTLYGVEYRYPGDYEPVLKEQAREALDIAEQVRDAILGNLKSYLAAGRPKN
jgi:HEPN domain-containing protein